MALPPKVQAQLAHAESLLSPPVAPAPEQGATADGPEAAATPEVNPPVQATPATPAPAQEAPKPQPPQSDASSWEQRYRSLQGVFKSAETKAAKLERDNAQMAERLEALSQEVAKRPAVPEDTKDAELFGADLVDMVKRVAETMFGSAVSTIDTRIASLEARLEGTAQAVSRTAEEVFYDQLSGLVPDYKTINTSQSFLDWLSEVDPVYGAPRQSALDRAAASLDVDRVSKVFMAFKGSRPAAPPKPSDQLNRQVAPASAASAPPPRSDARTVITTSDVQSFYKDLQLGRYVGKEQEARNVEAAINLALAEGRIVDRMPRHTPT